MDSAEDFFDKHRAHRRPIQELPDSNMSDEEIALWVLQGNHGNWLELDLDVNTEQFLKEELLAKNKYVSHRDSATGEGTHAKWSSCTLHGIDVDKTNHWETYGYTSEPEYNWTSLGIKTEAIRKFCEGLPFEKLSRVRFMKLGQKGYITPHSDGGSGIDWNNIWDHPLPINIALDHPETCFMTVKDSGVVPFKNGKSFLVNILKTHSVINFSNKDRIHLIVHGIVGNRKLDYCKFIAENYRKAHALQKQKN